MRPLPELALRLAAAAPLAARLGLRRLAPGRRLPLPGVALQGGHNRVNAETPIMQKIRLAIGGRPGVRIFRNTVGALQDRFGHWIVYGLCKGSSDLIGWTSVVVTPDMVGRRVAIFTAIEVKVPGSRTEPDRLKDQQSFIERVQADGGRAGFASDPVTAARIVDGR